MNELLKAALMYYENGYTVIAVDKNKRSVSTWREFSEGGTSVTALVKQFAHSEAVALAVICGEISGGLEVIDIDLKYDLTGQLYQQFVATVAKHDRELMAKLAIAHTRSGGYHLIYKSHHVEGNQVLARRPPTEHELKADPELRAKVLIETRGRRGYFLVAPSPGYRFIQGDLLGVPVISEMQRALLLTTATSFNLYHPKQLAPSAGSSPRPNRENSPLDDYNERGDVIALLEKHGWTVVGRTSDRTYLRRPGGTDKFNSGNFHHPSGHFRVFSTSTAFEPDVPYLPYAVYAVLECNNDFAEAVRRLVKEGFGRGSPTNRQEKQTWRRKRR